MGRRRGHLPHLRTVVRAALAASVVAALVPAVASAHPLGNFTINHYAGVRIEPDRILLDVVIDQAEIPAFQARLALDLDADGAISDAESVAGRETVCGDLRSSLDLRVDDVPTTLRLTEAGLAFPPGAGGLSTMREVCAYRADLSAPLTTGATVTFADSTFAQRLGWREIVVVGSGVSVAGANGAVAPSASISDRLTRYPPELLTRPLAMDSVTVVLTGAGPMLPPFDVPDAQALGSTPVSREPAPDAGPAAASAVVPGGVGSADLPSIFRSADLTPLVLFVSLLTAGALGAGHALTPGHGKTLMAAYLVGTKGRPLHALGLGLSVSVSHTVGILVLAALVVGAQGVLAPDAIVRGAPVVAAVSIVVIGGWMLFSELRRRQRVAAVAADSHHPHEHDHGHDHHHDHDTEHSHGGITHVHLPKTGSTITWRSLFVLGLAGGLVPSTSALLILLGSIAAGRPAFGFVLVVAFGVGMAAVMAGIGLAMVYARDHVDRIGGGSSLGRVTAFVPMAAAVLVFGLGLYLTAQAVSGPPTL